MTTVEQEFSVDAFHRGAFHVLQPRNGGHRSGVDAMILAACVPSGFAGRLADFGAGAGAAGLAVAARCPQAKVTLAERAREMLHFARLTLEHPGNAALKDRVTLLDVDVSLAGEAREAAGLLRASLDFVIMNPPFNAAHDRPTPDALKRQAHVMPEGLIEAWMRSAAAVVKPRGSVAIIARPDSLEALLASIRGRFGGAQIVPVQARADKSAIRVVLRARAGSRQRLSLMPPLLLHGPTGNGFTERADAINNGRASLFGD